MSEITILVGLPISVALWACAIGLVIAIFRFIRGDYD